MKTIYTFSVLLLAFLNSTAQTIIQGKISDEKNTPLPGVNIFIEGTYDGYNGRFYHFAKQQTGLG